MNRLAVAVACALLLHAGMFWIGSGWFMSGAVPPSIPRSVTVTLSYRNAPMPAAVKHTEPVKPPVISAPDKTRAPAKLPEKTALPREIRPEENNAASRSRQEHVTGAGEAAAPDDSRDSKIPKKATGDAAFVREAMPLYKVNPPPRYPAAARRRGQQGTVVLSVHVNEQGRAANVWLFESSGHSSLDNAALQAVKDWLFEPGMQGGRKVAMWVNVPVRFELK